ncbi:MAG: carbohydrate ABC transporter permease [Thermoplasmata archaeon]
MRIRPRTVVIHLIAYSVAVLWTIPFLGIFMTAIRPSSEILRGWWNLDPFTLTLDNFVSVLFNPLFPLITGLGSSAIIAITATLLPLGVGALAAYGFARFSFPLRDYMFLAIVLVMAIPTMMVIIPTFQTLINLNLLNSYLGLVLVHTAWGLPWIILFLRNFFGALPVEIEEAARVDGASDFKVFYRVVLPMALPALASVFVLQFMWVWSDFFFALILVVGDTSIWPATLQLPFASFAGQFHNDWGLLSAGSLLIMLVPIGIYVLLQKYYIRGMIGWTVKG